MNGCPPCHCRMQTHATAKLYACRFGTLQPCDMPLWHAASLRYAALARCVLAACLAAASATSCRTALCCGCCDILSHCTLLRQRPTVTVMLVTKQMVALSTGRTQCRTHYAKSNMGLSTAQSSCCLIPFSDNKCSELCGVFR